MNICIYIYIYLSALGSVIFGCMFYKTARVLYPIKFHAGGIWKQGMPALAQLTPKETIA